MKRSFFALAVLALLSATVNADTLRTFAIDDVNGSTSSTRAGLSTLSGLITIDTTTGQALYGYLRMDLPPERPGRSFRSAHHHANPQQCYQLRVPE